VICSILCTESHPVVILEMPFDPLAIFRFPVSTVQENRNRLGGCVMKKTVALLMMGWMASCAVRPPSTVSPQNTTTRFEAAETLAGSTASGLTSSPSSPLEPRRTATFTPGLFPGLTPTGTAAGELQAITSANAASLTQVGMLGKGSVVKAEWSPDGQWVAVASTQGIHIHRSQSLEEIRFIDTAFLPVTFEFSPDGNVLAVMVSSLHGNAVQFWSVPDGSKRNEWTNLDPDIMERVMQFSPDGSLLAFGTDGGSVVLRRVSDGEVESTVRMHSEMVTGLAFSPDGSMIASVSADGRSVLWRIWDGRLLRAYGDKFGWSGANCAAFSPDGTILAFGVSRLVRVYFASAYTELFTVEKTGGEVTSLEFSPDGSLLAAGTESDTAGVWGIPGGDLRYELTGHFYRVASVSFSPDGSRLASGAPDGVRVWDAVDGGMRLELKGFSAPLSAVAFSPDGTILVSGTSHLNGTDAEITVWRISDRSLLHRVKGPKDAVGQLVFSPDGTLLASGSIDGTVNLWRVSDFELVRSLQAHSARVSAVAFSPDGSLLASGSDDKTVKLWRVSDGSPVRTLEGHTNRVTSVAFSPDGTLLASGSEDETARLWNTSDGTPARSLKGGLYRVRSVAFSPDGTLLALGSDWGVEIRRVSDGSLRNTIHGDIGQVSGVAFSPDGSLLAAGTSNQAIYLWGASNGTLLHKSEIDTGLITDIAFSNSGALLASASHDGTIRLWGIPNPD